MIRIRKNYDDIPDKLTNPQGKQKIQEALEEKNNHNFSSAYYREGILPTLLELYRNKCGFCETNTTAGATLQVEHYRPKKAVTEEPDTHRGYYWLGYEWSNLLLACERCNNQGAKGNHFPLMPDGERIFEPPVNRDGELDTEQCRADSPKLLAEQPLLLNPELDTPDPHFLFLPNGAVRGLSDRGQATIDICKLNRQPLVLERKKIVDAFKQKISSALADFAEENITEATFRYHLKSIFSDLLRAEEPEREYARLGWFMFKKFELFFIRPLDEPHQTKLRAMFEAFQAGTLYD